MDVETALLMLEHQRPPTDSGTLIDAGYYLATEVRRLRDENMSLLRIIADIRAAVGDPGGVMMLSELIEHCREIYVDADRLRERETKARELMESATTIMDSANVGGWICDDMLDWIRSE